MKKIIFTLAVLLTATVSASAQGYVMKVMNGDVEVASHRVDAVTDIVFEDYVDDFWLDGATSALQNLAYGQTVDLTPYIKEGYTVASWSLSGDTGIENSEDSAVEISDAGLFTVNFFTDEASNGYHEMINRTVTITATDTEGYEHPTTATIAGGYFIHNFADGLGNIQIIPAENANDPVYTWTEGNKYVTVYLSSNGNQDMTIAHSGETAGSTNGGFMVDPTTYKYIIMAIDVPVTNNWAFYGAMYGYASTAMVDGSQASGNLAGSMYTYGSFGWDSTTPTVGPDVYGPAESANGIVIIDISKLTDISNYVDSDGLVSLDVLEFKVDKFETLTSSNTASGTPLTGKDSGGNYKVHWIGSFKSIDDAKTFYKSNM